MYDMQSRVEKQQKINVSYHRIFISVKFEKVKQVFKRFVSARKEMPIYPRLRLFSET
jgi:hypothetical protein